MLSGLPWLDGPFLVEVVRQWVGDHIDFRVFLQGFVTAMGARDVPFTGIGIGGVLAPRSNGQQPVSSGGGERFDQRAVDTCSRKQSPIKYFVHFEFLSRVM